MQFSYLFVNHTFLNDDGCVLQKVRFYFVFFQKIVLLDTFTELSYYRIFFHSSFCLFTKAWFLANKLCRHWLVFKNGTYTVYLICTAHVLNFPKMALSDTCENSQILELL